MERITKFNENKGIYILPECEDETACGGDCGICRYVVRAFNRLAEYEDKRESGQFVELPCKVGDTLYKPDLDSDRVLVGEVGKIYYVVTDTNKSYYITVNCGNRDKDLSWEKQILGWVFYPDKDWNISVFATREAAEARLKELQSK